MEKTESTGKTLQIKMMVLAAIFAALIAVGSIISIPIGPFVPIVLANLFVLLAGLLLGPVWAFASVGIYLLLGLVGMPVFAGGVPGTVAFVGPTGGFLFGYAAAAIMVGIISSNRKPRIWKDIVAVLAGIMVIYLIGVPWLKQSKALDWNLAIKYGFTPYIIGDLIKGAVAVFLAKVLRPQLNER